MSRNLKERVTSWKSTIIGFVFIAAALFGVLVKGLTWTDVTLPVTIGLGLVLSKDSLIDKFVK